MSSGNSHHHDSHTKSYVAVWIALLILTVVTVVTAGHNYGEWNIVIAMGIATFKASLVCLYFMHLKYENKLNQVVFVTSFIFLAIFAGFTMSDVLTRPQYLQARVHEIQGPNLVDPSKMKALAQVRPEQVTKGKGLYQINCASCHGVSGLGDGGAAGALNPKPRNFSSPEGWKKGRAPAQIFDTLTKGIEGSSMASFATLTVEDRWALVHYVRSLTPNPPADTPETLKLVGVEENSAASPTVAPKQPSVEIPITFAIDRLVKEAESLPESSPSE